ncbi:PAS domain-containing protein [Aequorivita capsosiphonis]|uniref:PAS domain-containing protein n=1 Tax=Aequorivita capsosiphonis TaxID=487317 RepID=UPI000407FE48|nr:PAS domain-containing protein [Aequorivita capsosiphonis]
MGNYNLWNMTGLDVFLQSLNEADRKKYKKEIQPHQDIFPLKSWGLSSDFFSPTNLINARKKDKEALMLLSKQFQWKTDITEILKNSYEALVVTDTFQNIVWTNPGFFEMTGYSETYVIGKKPSFLQGAETSTQTKRAIREKLLAGKPFTEKVLNYKENQQQYWCQIQVFPMYTKSHQTHYLALETELI